MPKNVRRNAVGKFFPTQNNVGGAPGCKEVSKNMAIYTCAQAKNILTPKVLGWLRHCAQGLHTE